MSRLEPVRGYPRPQLVREGWASLNGPWDFAIDFDASIRDPRRVEWASTINVPFAPETTLSGIGRTDLFHACWYRRQFDVPQGDAPTVLLHFGAVDYRATVWVNRQLVGTHEGGYTPFTCDISAATLSKTAFELSRKSADVPGSVSYTHLTLPTILRV